MESFVWSGARDACLDMPTVINLGIVSVGLYGGNISRGAHKNEDGALVWLGANWVFAAILDAHGTAESTNATLELLTAHQAKLMPILTGNEPSDFRRLHAALIEILSGPEARVRTAVEKSATVAAG